MCNITFYQLYFCKDHFTKLRTIALSVGEIVYVPLNVLTLEGCGKKDEPTSWIKTYTAPLIYEVKDFYKTNICMSCIS